MNLTFSVANNWSDFPETQRPTPWKTGEGNDGICSIADNEKEKWKIRMNDFPDEPLFTLIIDQKEIIHFDDWPEFWFYPELPKMNWK